ncbi:hypothetical protein AMS68_003913 [Peltaster fructicola]|uniref:Uncharacterized protein n=1 Tax=Peltaster fructicola TaxID=286661 RepID=A0A6H0XUN6_9PEZI|nr:hypothetical protein AMS68_003913 [Peltaster fructicola]
MGRGNSKRNRVLGANDDAAVEIPITLSTSPAQLMYASDTPFRIVLTAHNPGDRAITFWTLLTPFMSLEWGAFENIDCITTQEEKSIKIYPINWPHWMWNPEDLDREFMTTIPAAGQGCKWWTYGTLDDLKAIRLRSWRTLPEFDDLPDGEEDLEAKEWRETYGTGPWTFGEWPGDLCFVGQNVAEFEVVGGVEGSMSALSLETQP